MSLAPGPACADAGARCDADEDERGCGVKANASFVDPRWNAPIGTEIEGDECDFPPPKWLRVMGIHYLGGTDISRCDHLICNGLGRVQDCYPRVFGMGFPRGEQCYPVTVSPTVARATSGGVAEAAWLR